MSRADRHALARQLAAAAGVEVLVCADPANVHWLTGVVTEIETGPSPFAPAPVVVLVADEPPLLIASTDDAPAAPPDAVALTTYEGFTAGPITGPRRARELVLAAAGGRAVAVDSPLARGLSDEAARHVDVAGALLDARAVKDADELTAIRLAIAVADAGQERLRDLVSAGVTELELLDATRRAMNAAAGQRLPVLADLVSGLRGAQMGGPPTNRVIASGDLVLCDLAPRVDGTWGDWCSTVAAGEPARDHVAHQRRVAQALERAIAAVRPGARAGEIDALTRAGLDYPHHTGHGIGSSYHEAPRLVPGSETVLREGMVIALEPAFYAADFGMRLEHVVRVTADGCEDLSSHRLEL